MGKDTTLINNVGLGHGHGEWSADGWGHPDHFWHILLPLAIYIYITLHDLQGASTSFA